MKIGIFWPNWIGDAIMATPAVRAMRVRFPEARIVGILKPYTAGIIEGNPWLDEALLLNKVGPADQRWPAVVSRLRQERLDVAVLFPNSFRTALVAWLGGARKRLGFSRYGRGILLTDRLRPARRRLGRVLPSPVILEYNRIAMSLGCSDPGTALELFTTWTDEAKAIQVWEEARLYTHPLVACLNPGAAFGPAKCWPVESFAALARDLVDRRGAGILVLCGPNEKETARRILALAGRPSITSLADYPPSLGLTKACIRRADILITTDSGPRHIAAAFDRPVVTLFGPTHIEWTETFHPKAIHLQKKVPCGPCQRRSCPLDHRCMTQLTPGEVAAAVDELLGRHLKNIGKAG
jgi:heptosyltransferase-2